MFQYGWRIMFLTGVMPVLLALYMKKYLHESPEFEKAKKTGVIEKSPFLNMFKPPALWDFLQIFVFMTGLFLTDYSVYGFLPNILTLNGRGFDTTTFSLIYGFALFMAFLGYTLYGWVSDFTGRKKLTLYYSVFLILFAIPVYYVLYNAAVHRDLMMAIVGTLTLKMAAACVAGTRSGGDAARRASTLAVSSVKARSMPAIRRGISESAVSTSAMLAGSIIMLSSAENDTTGQTGLEGRESAGMNSYVFSVTASAAGRCTSSPGIHRAGATSEDGRSPGSGSCLPLATERRHGPPTPLARTTTRTASSPCRHEDRRRPREQAVQAETLAAFPV